MSITAADREVTEGIPIFLSNANACAVSIDFKQIGRLSYVKL